MFYFARAHKLIFALLNHRKEGMEIFQKKKRILQELIGYFLMMHMACKIHTDLGLLTEKCLVLLQNTKGN